MVNTLCRTGRGGDTTTCQSIVASRSYDITYTFNYGSCNSIIRGDNSGGGAGCQVGGDWFVVPKGRWYLSNSAIYFNGAVVASKNSNAVWTQ
ncbi:MAG: hypothetical protein WBP23_01090 [Candidatus Saccharimonadales bacterium]